jgi:rubrerythrin
VEDMDILKDLLEYRIRNQTTYNEHMINVRNPEVRQIFTQLRDDEMRDIVRIQQKIERNKGSTGIIAKIIPKKHKI